MYETKLRIVLKRNESRIISKIFICQITIHFLDNTVKITIKLTKFIVRYN